jgi:hypothetical protein
MDVIITAFRGEQRELMRALKRKGNFTKTNFRDVLLGNVEDVNKLIESLNNDLPLSLSRVMPLRELFLFDKPSDLTASLHKKLLSILMSLKASHSELLLSAGG